MNKEELEKQISLLQERVEANKTMNEGYESDLLKAEKQLADYNKPELTPEQFGDLEYAIQSAIEGFDFSNTDMYEIEYGINYDGKVHCESFDFNDSYELIEAVVKKASSLFAEFVEKEEEEEPVVEQVEQPVESQPAEEQVLLDPMPVAEPRETEVTHSKPSNEDMENLKQMAEEKKQNKEEKTFKKRSWFNK